MALIKNEIPILEYDTEKKAIIMPGHGWDYKFTKKAVMLFMEEEIDNYVSSHDCEVVGEFESITKKFPVYKIVHNGEKIVFCQAPLGGAAATPYYGSVDRRRGKRNHCHGLLRFID